MDVLIEVGPWIVWDVVVTSRINIAEVLHIFKRKSKHFAKQYSGTVI